jgi:hypothetical protein
MYKNLKLSLLTLLALLFANLQIASAEIKWHAPFSQTGTYQSLLKLVHQGLEEKGWKLDLKITGNPKLGRDIFNETNEPFLLAWGIELISMKNDPHYIKPANNDSLVGFVHVTGVYLCTNKNITHEDFVNKKYKIGTVGDRTTLNFLNKWMAFTKNKHDVISYRGSGDLEIGFNSGEIDLIFASRGVNLHESGKANCLYTSGRNTILGIPTIQSKFPEFKDGQYSFGTYIVAKNFSKENLEKLRNDLANVKKDYAPFTTHMKKMHFTIVHDDIPTQIANIKKIDDTLE